MSGGPAGPGNVRSRQNASSVGCAAKASRAFTTPPCASSADCGSSPKRPGRLAKKALAMAVVTTAAGTRFGMPPMKMRSR